MEDAVTLNACHFIQMWQHLKRALEEFAKIKLKSKFMHLKIRRPSALRLSLLLWRPARTTATIISSVVWPGEEKCSATGRSAFFETDLRCSQNLSPSLRPVSPTFRMPDKLWYTRGYLSCMRTSAVFIYNNFIRNNQYKKAAIREELNPYVRWPPENIYKAIKEI